MQYTILCGFLPWLYCMIGWSSYIVMLGGIDEGFQTTKIGILALFFAGAAVAARRVLEQGATPKRASLIQAVVVLLPVTLLLREIYIPLRVLPIWLPGRYLLSHWDWYWGNIFAVVVTALLQTAILVRIRRRRHEGTA